MKLKPVLTASILTLSLMGCGDAKEQDATQETSQETSKETSEMEAAIQSENTNFIIEDTQVGEGKEAKAGQEIVVHYTGTLEDGTKFDSSVDRGMPFTFTLGVGQVIQGWDQGFDGMKVGGKRKLTIPSDMGYGDRGAGPIPGGATLIFEVELLDVLD